MRRLSVASGSVSPRAPFPAPVPFLFDFEAVVLVPSAVGVIVPVDVVVPVGDELEPSLTGVNDGCLGACTFNSQASLESAVVPFFLHSPT